MIGLKIEQAKGMFFDSEKVVRSVDAATRRVLSKFGAFVRRAAKSSIRKRKRPSEPNQPPSSHTGLLRQFIFFGYDESRRSVVIGPTLINGSSGAPEVLEFGGTATVSRRRRVGGQVRYEKKRVAIAKRPFMNPALKQELPKLPAMWRDSVKP